MRTGLLALLLAVALLALQRPATGHQDQAGAFSPRIGQPGKDVEWVPTPQALVDTMLDMAAVSPSDRLMDLGSGDGITVITAARRGVRAHGVEYDPRLVELARRNARAAGVSSLATFEQGDLFEADLSQATVITLFLLPELNMQLRPKLLALKPGTRIVSNSFTMQDWASDRSEQIEPCSKWCFAYLWIVPAQVAGTWSTPRGELQLTQRFQKVSGVLGTAPLVDVRLAGDQIGFNVGLARYDGRVEGNRMRGTVTESGRVTEWTATRR